MAEKKQSILVVDDEPEILNSLHDTFIGKYNMFKANSAKEALEIIDKNWIDLVISDQIMPETTGVELFEQMEKNHPHIGKVLLTGYLDIHAAVDAINKGHVDKYIAKPWDEDDIIHIVFEVMDTKLKKALKELKHADEELIKTSSFLQATLDSTHDGILEVDLNGKISNYNKKFLEMWGIPDSIMGDAYDQEALDYAVHQLENPESFITKTQYLHEHPEATTIDIIELKNGTIFERYSQPQKIEDQVVGRVWSFHDITKQKQAEDRFKKSEQALRDVLELTSCITNIAPYANIVADSKGRILDANPASENIFGYKMNELIGRNVSILTPSRKQDEYTKYIKSHMAYKKTGKPQRRRFIRGPEECTAIKKDGEEFPILLFIRETRSKGKDIFVGIIEEFTERKKREKELKKAEQYIRNLIECSMDMIISVDKERKIVEFNKAAEKSFGYTKEEIIGKNIEIIYATHEEAEAMSVLLQGRDHFSTEILNKRKNGEIFPSFASISVIKDVQGNMIGTMGVSRDITYQKEAEEELRTAKFKAEEANRIKDEFLANMSHEIRTPLNGIIGMAELLIDTDIKDAQLNLVRTLNSEANALLSIINNVLDFSKIEAAKLDLEAIDFNLTTVIDDIVNSFAYRATQKGLELHSLIYQNVPCRLTGDPVRLRQILTNLIGNSLKFTHEGEIFIKTELKEDHENWADILFSIKDTGIGIPKDRQEHIFESFCQADGSTTRKYGGTGLGTTIARQLVRLMGGEICLESEKGKGCTFYFNVVFAKQEEKQDGLTRENFDLTGKKILIVDDNETNRFVITEHLKSWGCLSIEASGGKEALEILDASQKSIDLIITDYMMPEVDGFGLVKLIRERDYLKKIPIILLTTVGEIGDAQICKDLGIQSYLTKPIRQDYLRKVIESVFLQASKGVDDSGQTLVTRHTIADKREKDVEILLAEDYPTNQEVAIRHLQSAGYRVDLAENGVQAFEAYKKKLYDIIYMDIQMPEMDGYEATAKIRDYEKELKDLDSRLEANTVIIAMTAHATVKDREKCLERGMDDFISKPLRRKELLALTDKWVSKIQSSQSAADPVKPAETIPQPSVTENRKSPIENRQSRQDAPIDFDLAVDEFEGDREYLIKVLDGFLKNVNKQIITIRQAISDGDADVVRKEAHSIKGGAGNLTADDLSRAALELENIGKSGNLTEGTKVFAKLENELKRLEEYAGGME